jgi:tRNA dimethylallyltransferase
VSDAEASALSRVVAIAERDPDAIVAVVGATASGKTSLAIGLAERIGGEIVSCDSVQVYRGFDVGAGKPTPVELARAPHHMLGVYDPLEAVDAASFAKRAEAVIADIRARGRRPIVCGGTFLWAKALLYGLADAPPADADIRARHRAVVESDGRSALHARLAAVDPVSAARLHPNDFVRVSRALEVHELTGRPMSAWLAEHAFGTVRHRARFVAIEHDAATLTARIEARVAAMLAAGWVDEVRTLVANGFGDARAMGAVGYRDVRRHLDGALSRDELPATIVRATRVFARRQRTWLRAADVEWLTPPSE